MPNYQFLNEWLRYDPKTGYLWWRERPNNRSDIGKPVGVPSGGRLYVNFRGRNYIVHRLVWFLHYGVWPTHTIRHINRNGLDNRIANLSDEPLQSNLIRTRVHSRSKLGVKGVIYDYNNKTNPYRVEIMRHGKTVLYSSHPTLEAATKVANDFYASE